MNRAISKRPWKAHSVHLDPNDGHRLYCPHFSPCHAVHDENLLSFFPLMDSRAIFGMLGLVPSPEESDLYEEARHHPVAYWADEDPAVIEEMQIHA
jgi:hypothetical protein